MAPANIEDTDLSEDIDLSEVKFIQKIHGGEFSEIFKVEALGRVCVLKVVCLLYLALVDARALKPAIRSDNNKAYWEPTESKLFGWESAAYRRFKERGLCARGIVPDFYGCITNIDPTQWPELRSFRKDPLPPKAIFIEYIHHLKRIYLKNYSEKRVARLADLLADIHAVRVVHGDPHPRNMCLVPQEDGERLLWMDFDRASTFPLDRDLTAEETKDLRYDMRLMREYIVRPTEQDPDWLMMWTREMTLPFSSS